MSKPRSKWWAGAKAMVREYPRLKDKSVEGVELREVAAVRSAITKTEAMATGKDRLRVVEMVLWKGTHTLTGAALVIPCSYETAKRYQQDFIRLAGREFGVIS